MITSKDELFAAFLPLHTHTLASGAEIHLLPLTEDQYALIQQELGANVDGQTFLRAILAICIVHPVTHAPFLTLAERDELKIGVKDLQVLADLVSDINGFDQFLEDDTPIKKPSGDSAPNITPSGDLPPNGEFTHESLANA